MEICSPSRHSFRHRTQGSVLIIVMWVSLGLVSVTLYFAHSMYFEFKAAGNVYEGHQAQQAIDGALRYATYLLANLEEPGTLPEVDTYVAQQALIGEATFCISAAVRKVVLPLLPYSLWWMKDRN